jgi:hypothetical protein
MCTAGGHSHAALKNIKWVYFLLLTLINFLPDFSLPPPVPKENPPEEAFCSPNLKTSGEADVVEANWVAAELKIGVGGELLGVPKGKIVEKGDSFLSVLVFPPFIWPITVVEPVAGLTPNIGVVGDELGIEGVAAVNENTAPGVELTGVAEPLFGKPVADIVNLLPNAGDVENVEPDPVAGLDMGDKGETTAEFAELCESCAEFCVNNALLLFPCWVWLFLEKIVGSGETALDLSWVTKELPVPNCWEKLKGGLLLTALDLSWVAEELAVPNCGKKLNVPLEFPVPEDTSDGARKDLTVAPVTSDKLPVPELEVPPPVEICCADTEAELVKTASETALGDEALPIDPLAGRKSETTEFDACWRPLFKVDNSEFANLKTGLQVKDVTCPELLEDISWSSAFIFLLHFCAIDPSSKTDFEILDIHWC